MIRTIWIFMVFMLVARTSAAQTRLLTVVGDPENPTVDASWKLDDALPVSGPVTLAVTCDGGTDCRRIEVLATKNGLTGTSWTRSPDATLSVATFIIARSELGMTGPAVVVRIEGREFARPSAAPPTTGTASTSPWTGRSFVPCDTNVVAAGRGSDHAVFLVTPDGSVVARSDAYIDEDDRVTVYVRGTPEVIQRVSIRRSSEFRNFADLSLLGMDAKIPTGLVLHANEDQPCTMTSATVENFKGGEAGEVEILLMTPKKDAPEQTEPQSAGKLQFPVHRLYRGAFSFGIMRTELSGPSYSVAEGDSVLRESGAGRRFLYTLAYTPYLWGPRDVEEWSLRHLPRYINPTFGVGINEPGKNVLAGLTLELPSGIFLTAGWHAGRVSRAAEGLQAGDVVPAARRKVVADDHWEHDSFYSLTVDLRAAAKFLTALAGGS